MRKRSLVDGSRVERDGAVRTGFMYKQRLLRPFEQCSAGTAVCLVDGTTFCDLLHYVRCASSPLSTKRFRQHHGAIPASCIHGLLHHPNARNLSFVFRVCHWDVNSPLRSGWAPADESAVMWALVWIWVVVIDKSLTEIRRWNFCNILNFRVFLMRAEFSVNQLLGSELSQFEASGLR